MMNVIVPMAGKGSRLRPHTLTIPKPLLPVGGKPIVHRLVEDIADICKNQIGEIAFVIGEFGSEVEKELIFVAEALGAKGKIYYQHQALGTAHAVLCAAESLQGETVIAFADTLFKADFSMAEKADGVLWVKQISDPSAFGVVKLDKDGCIVEFVEKSKVFVSDLAMIGIYFVRDGVALRKELQYLIDNNVQSGGEYQFPDALRRMVDSGKKFVPGKVDEWLDCGNKEVTVFTNQRVLEFDKSKKLVHDSLKNVNSVIHPPCFIGEGVELEGSEIGPYVSIGAGTRVKNSVITNSIIQKNSEIADSKLTGSMVGNFARILHYTGDISIGDYCVIGK